MANPLSLDALRRALGETSSIKLGQACIVFEQSLVNDGNTALANQVTRRRISPMLRALQFEAVGIEGSGFNRDIVFRKGS